MFKNRNNKGFTIIELLVVISIISVVSSVVLASVNSTRIKARNTYVIQTIRQYVLALESSFSENGYYPYPGDSGLYCLGQAPCYLSYISNAAVNTELSKYLPSLPKSNFSPVPVIGGSVTNSFFYCSKVQSGYCRAFLIFYYLEGNTSCVLQNIKSLNNNNTQCQTHPGELWGLCNNGIDDNSNSIIDEAGEC